MTTTDIISAIDEEISKLQQVRSLLSCYSDPTPTAIKRGPGRPKKTVSASTMKRAIYLMK